MATQELYTSLFPRTGDKRFQVNLFDADGTYIGGKDFINARDALNATQGKDAHLHDTHSGLVWFAARRDATEYYPAALWETFRAEMDL